MIVHLIKKFYYFVVPNDAPPEKAPLFYYNLLRIYQTKLFLPIRKILSFLASYSSFDLPKEFFSYKNSKRHSRAFKFGLVTSLFFCFVVNAVWSYFVGTFSGDKFNIYYFRDDTPNLVNYFFLVPLYVGFGSYILSLIGEGFLYLKKLLKKYSGEKVPLVIPKGTLPIIVIISFTISGFLTINYINEILNPNVYEKNFWFVKIAASGERMLSSLGIYYTIMTFSLLYFSIIVIMSYLSFFLLTVSIGNSIGNVVSIKNINETELKNELQYFIKASFFAKILAAIYMLNAFTWYMQNPMHSINYKIMLVVLLILGVFIVTLPRYYIELKLYKMKCIELLKNSRDCSELHYTDLRPRNIKILSLLLDGTIITFFTTFFFGF